MAIVRAAVVQDAPVAFDLDRSLEKVVARTADAAANGALSVPGPVTEKPLDANAMQLEVVRVSRLFAQTGA